MLYSGMPSRHHLANILAIFASMLLFTCSGIVGDSSAVATTGDNAAGQGDASSGGDQRSAGDSATPPPGDSTLPPFSCSNRMPDHPEWLLCDDFELGAGNFDSWLAATPFHEFDGEDDRGRLDIASDMVHSGNHSLHMPAAASSGYKGASATWVACDGDYERGCDLGGHDSLFLKAWVRFDPTHVFVHHFLRMGGRYTSASPYNDGFSGYYLNGTAGCLPNGETHMDMTVEVDRDTDPLHHDTGYFYSYHPNMGLSNCGGSDNSRFDDICRDCNRWDLIKLEPKCSNTDHRCYWGDSFKLSDAAITAEPARYTFPKGEWFCVEVAMQSNTPGQFDGKMSYWINDKLAHQVDDMMWRTVDSLALNKVMLQHYISGQYWFGTPVQSNKVWFDDVVISTQRIGCD